MSDTTKILSNHVYEFTKENLANFKGNYFEIGIFNGVGTAQIAEAFPDKTIYALDPFIEDGYTTDASGVNRGEPMLSQREAALINLAPYSNVTVIGDMSIVFSRHLMAEDIIKYNVAWVVIDGSHHYEDVIEDAELARKLIDHRQGTIVFDDLQHEGVMRAYNEFKERYAFRIVGETKIGFQESCGVIEFGGKISS